MQNRVTKPNYGLGAKNVKEWNQILTEFQGQIPGLEKVKGTKPAWEDGVPYSDIS